MSKYIDADKLIATLERQNVDKKIIQPIIRIIDSLQQEQSAKRGYKDCNGCEYNRLLKDQIGWQFRGCFGGDYNGKPIAEIELCPLKVAAQQEQQEEPVSDNLEEEVKRYYSENFSYITSDNPTLSILTNIARHFAEWQYQKDRGEFAKIKAKTWCEGFDACKAKMMEGAVECVVCAGMEGNKWIMTYIGSYESMLTTCKAGDKVKLIICKEDGK